MCVRPATIGGFQVSCRKCDACIGNRKKFWLGRALAEKAMHPFCFSITLTYGNETQFQRDGAAFFRYEDVRQLLHRLRSDAFATFGVRGLRFLCCGEQGDRHGRVHYHLILFSPSDITKLGEFSTPWQDSVLPCDVVTKSGEPPKRLNWSKWPHGYVLFQEPDEGGISYALSYALKDQFSAMESQGSARITRSENFGTGLFRQSRRPSIGLPYFDRLFADLRSRGAVLPSLRLIIPPMRRHWFPIGTMRRYFLESLRQLNDDIRLQTGRDAPQWSSLLASLADNDNDLRVLNGQTIEAESVEDLAADIRAKHAYNQRDHFIAQTVRNCGSSVACHACLNSYHPAFLSQHGIEPFEGGFRFAKSDPEGHALRSAQSDRQAGGLNPLCLSKDSPAARLAFPKSAAAHGFG